MQLSVTTWSFSLSLLIMLSGCATTKDFFASAKNAFARSDDKHGPAATSAAGEVVQQTGRTTAVISRLNRKAWIDMRETAKDDRSRMYAALGAGEAAVAETEARQILKKHPNDLAGFRVLATSLVLQRKYELAEFYAKLIDTHHPGTAIAANIRGIAVMLRSQNRVEDFETAVKFFEQALSNSSTEIAAGLNLGYLQLELGNAQAAASTLDITRIRCGDCKEALMGSGIAMARSGNHRGAENRFNQVLAKHPKNAEAIYRLALVAKYGYNDKQTAIKNLKIILTDANVSGADRVLKQRASTMLRGLEAEIDRPSTTKMASESDDHNAAPRSADDKQDAEAMMTGMENEEPAP